MIKNEINDNLIKLGWATRLDKEKGLDLVMNWISNYAHDLQGKVTIDFYGDGKLRSQLDALALQFPQIVRVHGYVPLSQIIHQFHQFDYNLMPSRFLETFGLTALDFACCGVATIGYKKGGVAPFIQDSPEGLGTSLNIASYLGENEQEQFDTAMNQIIVNAECKTCQPDRLVQNSKGTEDGNNFNKDDIKTKYSQEKRLDKFFHLV